MSASTAFYINGEWRKAASAERVDVHDSFTEDVIGSSPVATAQEVDAAVSAARGALRAWSRTPVRERIEVVRKIGSLIEAETDDLARSMTAETGMPIRHSRKLQVGLPVQAIGGYLEAADRMAWEEELGESIVRRIPVGVVGAITPWNYPLHQIICKMAPALIAGCTMVVKPSEIAPITAARLFEMLDTLGLPPGTVNMITGLGAETGKALVTHPGLDCITFTGSTAVGKQVAAAASGQLKRVVLELGGKSPSVVLDEASLEAAVKTTVGVSFVNQGQTCMAWTRLLVPNHLLDQAIDMVAANVDKFTVGDPYDEGTRMGPLSTDAQAQRVRGMVAQAIDDGATVVRGGADRPEGMPHGYFVQPTVLASVDPAATIAQEEVFGPVLTVFGYASEDEALAVANGTRYGLHAGVWAQDEAKALDFAKDVIAGQVDINGSKFNPVAPFGGLKESGWGRELGTYGIEEYLAVQSIQL